MPKCDNFRTIEVGADRTPQQVNEPDHEWVFIRQVEDSDIFYCLHCLAYIRVQPDIEHGGKGV